MSDTPSSPASGFLAETAVMVEIGQMKSLQYIAAGDSVNTFSPPDNAHSEGKVLEIVSGNASTMVRIMFDGGHSLDCTPDQLFWEIGANQWVRAEKLIPTHRLLSPSGQPVAITEAYEAKIEGTTRNLKVGPVNTFYVGEIAPVLTKGV